MAMEVRCSWIGGSPNEVPIHDQRVMDDVSIERDNVSDSRKDNLHVRRYTSSIVIWNLSLRVFLLHFLPLRSPSNSITFFSSAINMFKNTFFSDHSVHQSKLGGIY